MQCMKLLLTYSVVTVIWIKPSWKKMSCFNQKELTIIVRYTEIWK